MNYFWFFIQKIECFYVVSLIKQKLEFKNETPRFIVSMSIWWLWWTPPYVLSRVLCHLNWLRMNIKIPYKRQIKTGRVGTHQRAWSLNFLKIFRVTPKYVLSTYCRSLRPFHSWLRLLFTTHSVQYTQYTLSVHISSYHPSLCVDASLL